MKYLGDYYLSFTITISITNLCQPVLLTFLVHLLNPSVNTGLFPILALWLKGDCCENIESHLNGLLQILPYHAYKNLGHARELALPILFINILDIHCFDFSSSSCAPYLWKIWKVTAKGGVNQWW